MRFNTFKDVFAPVTLPGQDITFDDFVAKLSASPRIKAKEDGLLFNLARFTSTERKIENVDSLDGVIIDYDGKKVKSKGNKETNVDGGVTLHQAVDLFEKEGIKAVLYTTPSHTEKRPRWRAVFEASKSITKAQLEYLVTKLNVLIGEAYSKETLDMSCNESNRPYYFESVIGTVYYTKVTEGTFIDLVWDVPSDDVINAGKVVKQEIISVPTATQQQCDFMLSFIPPRQLSRKEYIVESGTYKAAGCSDNAIMKRSSLVDGFNEEHEIKLLASLKDSTYRPSCYSQLLREFSIHAPIEYEAMVCDFPNLSLGMNRIDAKRYQGAPAVPYEHDDADFWMTALNGTTVRVRTHNDKSNAYRLYDHYGAFTRYITDAKQWLCWQGTWLMDDGAGPKSYARELSNILVAEQALFGVEHLDDEGQKAYRSRLSGVCSASKMNNAVDELRNLPELAIAMGALNANPMLVGFDGAKRVIDLTTGVGRLAEPFDYVTKSLGLDRLGEAQKAVKWRSTLLAVLGGDRELFDWLCRYFGYLLTGKVTDQSFLFFYGNGSNGKSLIIAVLSYILGEYAGVLPSGALAEGKKDSNNPYIADLAGMRYVFCNEMSSGQSLDEPLIKQLVGGDKTTAMRKHCNPITFTPQAKIVMDGNSRPQIKGTDDGIWRRVRVIEFPVKFSGDTNNINLLDELKEEAPHILALMVQDCLRYQTQGLLDVPRSVMLATTQYKNNEDYFGQFVFDTFEETAGPSASIPVRAMEQMLLDWIKTNNTGVPMSSRQISAELRSRKLNVGEVGAAKITSLKGYRVRMENIGMG